MTNEPNENQTTDINLNQGEPAQLDEPTIKDIETTIANLHIVREQAKELELHTKELEQRLNLARGTGDVTEKARVAAQLDAAQPVVAVPRTRTAPMPAPRRPATNKERVEAALRGQSLNTAQVAKVTGLSIGKSSEGIRQLRADKRITNVGSEDFPKWTLRIGDDTPTSTLRAEVARLIGDQPMTMQELVEATGARTSRVSGVLVDLQRKETGRILNLGSERRARWLMLGEGVKLGNLAPKRSGDKH